MSSGRGRGRRKFTVDSLFQDTSARAAGVRDLVDAKEIDIERIEPDPEQPRQTFNPDALDELAESITREGVLQPIAVRYDEESDRYIILHGERRWRASRLAGLSVVPAIVRDVPEERRLLQQLMENVVREDLNAVDRAAALRHLKRQMDDAPWERVAEAVGIRRSRLFQLLSTEKLVESVQDRIRNGQLSEKQTRSLQGLSPDAQEALAGALTEGIGEQQLRTLARQLRHDEGYLEMDVPELRKHIEHLRSAAEESRPSEHAEGDPLVNALRDLFVDRDLPDDRDAVLNAISIARAGESHETGEELQRLGAVIGRIAAGEPDAGVSERQLRALRRLIDLALKSKR